MPRHDGKQLCDLTLACLGEGDVVLAGSGAAEAFHVRWFERHLPADGCGCAPFASRRAMPT